MAVTEMEVAVCAGSLSGKLNGNASNETTDAASACNSFWDVEGTGAGATGKARLASRNMPS